MELEDKKIHKIIQARISLAQYNKIELLRKHGFIKNFAQLVYDGVLREIMRHDDEGDFEYISGQEEAKIKKKALEDERENPEK